MIRRIPGWVLIGVVGIVAIAAGAYLAREVWFPSVSADGAAFTPYGDPDTLTCICPS